MSHSVAGCNGSHRKYTPTAEMLADGLTKPLPGQKFEEFTKNLGLIDVKPLIDSITESDSEE